MAAMRSAAGLVRSPPVLKGAANPAYRTGRWEGIKPSRKHRKTACEDCGATKEANGRGLSIHHIDTNRKNTDAANCATLCVRCHLRRHAAEKSGPFNRPAAKVYTCPDCGGPRSRKAKRCLACSGPARVTRVEIACSWCEKKIIRHPSHLKRAAAKLYCSIACRAADWRANGRPW